MTQPQEVEIKKTELSDGSIVYDVLVSATDESGKVGTIKIECLSEWQASDLRELLSDTSSVSFTRLPS